MKKDIKSNDKISEQTLHEILLDIKYRLDHIEDMEADNRSFIIKMIKQGNSIVKFLAQIDLEPLDNPFDGTELPPIDNIENPIEEPETGPPEEDTTIVAEETKKPVAEVIPEVVEDKVPEGVNEFKPKGKKNDKTK